MFFSAEAAGLIFVIPHKEPRKSIKDFLQLLFHLTKKSLAVRLTPNN